MGWADGGSQTQGGTAGTVGTVGSVEFSPGSIPGCAPAGWCYVTSVLSTANLNNTQPTPTHGQECAPVWERAPEGGGVIGGPRQRQPPCTTSTTSTPATMATIGRCWTATRLGRSSRRDGLVVTLACSNPPPDPE